MVEKFQFALNKLLVRNMDIKDFACEGSGESEKHDRQSRYYLREYL